LRSCFQSQKGILKEESPGRTPLSMSFSPQHHCMSSQLHQRGPRFAPTPCSMPDKPVASQAITAAVSSAPATEGSMARPREKLSQPTSPHHCPQQKVYPQELCVTCRYSCPRCMQEQHMSQIHPGLEPEVCSPNGLSPTGSFPESTYMQWCLCSSSSSTR
jgi:hypothetical protein